MSKLPRSAPLVTRRSLQRLSALLLRARMDARASARSVLSVLTRSAIAEGYIRVEPEERKKVVEDSWEGMEDG